MATNQKAKVSITTLIVFFGLIVATFGELLHHLIPGLPGGTLSGQGLVPTEGSELLVPVLSLGLISAALIIGIVLTLRTHRESKIAEQRFEMIRGVFHDVKTPLTLVRLYGEILRNDLESDEQHSKYCGIILNETKQLEQMIGQLTDFTKVSWGFQQFDFQKSDLAEILTECIESYAGHLKERGFRVDIRLDSSTPKVLCDPKAVISAVRNLMDNARKYSVDNKFVRVSLWAGRNSVNLEVEDHGIGVNAREHSRIFSPFYRADFRSFTDGFGLGLFLVQGVMRAHGGKVLLESNRGTGSRFRLVFPSAKDTRAKVVDFLASIWTRTYRVESAEWSDSSGPAPR
jgi:signal transduction histidine kinase